MFPYLYLRTWQFSQNIRPGVLFRNRMNFCCQNHIEYLVIFILFLQISAMYIYIYNIYVYIYIFTYIYI